MTRKNFRIALSAVVSLALAGCDPTPRAQVDEWGIARKPDGSGYSVKVKGKVWGNGSVFASLDYMDHNGCVGIASLDGIFPEDGEADVSSVYDVPTKAKIEHAKLLFKFVPKDGNTMNIDSYQTLFANERGVDPLPPGKKPGPCKRDKKTPETSFGQSSREENAATMINVAGYLCGRVLEAYSVGGSKIIVRCTLYRDGRGKAKYEIDTDTAEVTQLE